LGGQTATNSIIIKSMSPVAALIIANIIWGAASPIFKFALTNIPPYMLAFIRFFFAGILFIPFLKLAKVKKITRRQWKNIFFASLASVVNIMFFFWGVGKTASINVPIIASSGPLLLFIFSIFFLREKPKARVFLGMIISFIGVLTVILMPFLQKGSNSFGQLEGNLMIVAATIGSVTQPLLLKSVLKKINAITITFFVFIFSSFFFLLGVPFELEHWSFTQLNAAGWTGISFGILLSSWLAYFLYLYGLSKIDAQEIGIFSYIDPVIAVLIAIPLLGEYPNFYFILGSFFIFLGIFVAEKRVHWHPLHRLGFIRKKPDRRN